MRSTKHGLYALIAVLAMIASLSPAANAAGVPGVDAPAVSPPAASAAPVGPADQFSKPGPGVVGHETGAAGKDLYIVLHQAPSLAQYAGQVAGLAATTPSVTGKTRLDVKSAASVAYLGYLKTQQDKLLADIGRALGRSVTAQYRYDAVLNGVAVRMNKDEALKVAALNGVRKVDRNAPRKLLTDNGPRWIGADAVWGQDDPGAAACVGSCGEGVVIGVIDTGINHDHPSFADPGPVDGYGYPSASVVMGGPGFKGLCDPITGAPFCNDKLIGYWDFTAEPGGPDDLNGHGSHTASTAGGNVVDVELTAPTTTFERRISGVAPHANIIAYKACGAEPSGTFGCFPLLAPLLASINQATLDMVDVINYSIGGGSGNPWVDDDAQAFFDAYTAGIFVATSAGNEGPGAATLGSPADAPWVTAVGASTHDRALSNGLVDIENGDGTAGINDIFGKSLTAPLPRARVVYAGDYADESADPANARRCGAGVGNAATGEGTEDPWPAGTFNGEIVVCERGEYGRVFKGEYVRRAGAGGMVLANDAANGNSLIGDPHVLPAVHISYDDGEVLKAWIASQGGKTTQGTGVIRGSEAAEDAGGADVMAGFSSRGQNPAVPDLVKPDVTAPGVDILAAFNTPLGGLPGDAPEYGVISGTSMSSPHTAGAGALVLGAKPSWTPDQVKSALMSTAFTKLPAVDGEVHGVLKEDGTTPADPFDMGGGRVDLRQATKAGLIMNVGAAAYDAANPGTGGEPSTLNIASMGEDECEKTCSWTRTVQATVAGTWTASTTAPTGMNLTVSPASFTLAPNQSQVITVTADVAAVTPKNVWTFAEVRFDPNTDGVPDTHFPVAVIPKGAVAPGEVLHLHGNTHDDCDGLPYSGDGRADLVSGCDPFMSPDPELDTAPAARWGPLSPALSGTAPQNLYDPNWIWNLTEQTKLKGPMVVQWWAGGPGANPVFNFAYDITLFADGVEVVTQQVNHNLATPNVPQLLSSTVQVPAVTAETSYVVQIDPVYIDSQQGSFIYYDSQLDCPGASSGPCDSRITMPVVRGPQAPIAKDDNAFVLAGGSTNIDVLANDSDPEDGPLVVEVSAAPAHGTATVNFDKTISYTHDGSATTSDSFQYKITDNQGLTDFATVSITISDSCFSPGGDYSDDFESGAPGWTTESAVLAAPSQPWTLQTDPATMSNGWFTDALANDALADTAKDVRLVSPAQLVSGDTHLSFEHRYSTEAGYDGGVLEIRVDDGPWKDVEAAGGVFIADGYDGTLSGGYALGGRKAWTGDSDGWPLGMTTVDVDLGGLVGKTIQVRFRLGQDQNSGGPGWWIDDVAFSDLFEYCTAPPSAANDGATVDAGNSVNIDVKENDSDPDTAKADLTVTIETPAGRGTTAVQPDGTVTYTHDGSPTISDSFQYRITDPEGNFDVATVAISVRHPNNQAPVAGDDTATVSQGGSATIPVKDNDSDPNHANSQLTVTIETDPGHGTAGVTPEGEVVYTHNGDSATGDSFTYRVTDPLGAYDTATVAITIEANPDACRNDLCANKVKPDELTLTYTGGDCSDANDSQGSKSECTDYAGEVSGDVYIKATNKENASDSSAKVFYSGGPVSEGESFTLMAANAGEKDFGSKVFIHLYAADGVTLLETVQIATDCSAPLVEGEQYGAVKLGDPETNPEAPVCTAGQGKVHGSGKLARNSGEKYDDIRFEFEAKSYKKGAYKGKLKVDDKGLGAKIDARKITSLTTGKGVSCDGVVLDGVNSFVFTAEGTYERNGEKHAASFFACGIDNGKNKAAPYDYFAVECVSGCSYSTAARTPDSYIDSGEIHLHDKIVNPV